MGTNDPQGPPQTDDAGRLDVDRTGSPDQGSPEEQAALAELAARQEALAAQEPASGGSEGQEPVSTENPPAAPADTQEG